MADRTEELRTHAVGQQMRERWNGPMDENRLRLDPDELSVSLADHQAEIIALKEQLREAEQRAQYWHEAYEIDRDICHRDLTAMRQRAEQAESELKRADALREYAQRCVDIWRKAAMDANKRAQQAEARLAMATEFRLPDYWVIQRHHWEDAPQRWGLYRDEDDLVATYPTREAAFAAWEAWQRAQEGESR